MTVIKLRETLYAWCAYLGGWTLAYVVAAMIILVYRWLLL